MARLPSWAETCEVNTAKLVCNLAARNPGRTPKAPGLQSWASIPSRSVTMKSRWGSLPYPGGWVSIRTFTRESIFLHILEIPLQQSACSAKFSWIRRRRREIFGNGSNFDQE